MPFLDTDCVRLYVQVIGDRGLPIIFVNGWAATCQMWLPLVKRLSRSYRCVLYDPRGTGRSLATALGTTFEVEDAVADLHAVLRYVQGWDAHVVGQGTGAVVSLLAARERPQNFSSLTLIGTECLPPPTGRDREAETDLLWTQARVLLQEAATLPYVRQLLLWRYRRVPEPHRTQLYEDFAATDPRAAYGLAQSIRDVVIRLRFWEALRQVPLPILLVRGRWMMCFHPQPTGICLTASSGDRRQRCVRPVTCQPWNTLTSAPSCSRTSFGRNRCRPTARESGRFRPGQPSGGRAWETGSGGKAAQQQQGQVIRRGCASDKAAHGFLHPIAQARGTEAPVFEDGLGKSFQSQNFALFVQAFGQAVGVDGKHIAGQQTDLVNRRCDVGQNPKGNPLGRKFGIGAIRAHEQSRVMTGAGVVEDAGGRVEFRAKQGEKLVFGGIFDQVIIDGRDDVGQRPRRLRLGAQRRVDARHHQRRPHAFAGHVADGQQELVVTTGNEVVVVPADFTAGKAESGDVPAGQLRGRVGCRLS